MRELTCGAITAAVSALCQAANTQLPQDLRRSLLRAQTAEVSPVGQSILSDLAENFTLAAEKTLPICQDTGMAVVFADLGQDLHITGGLLTDAVNAGVAQGYGEGYLRCSVVADPLRRTNTGDNTPAILHLRMVAGDRLTLTVAPKGFGSENMSALKLFSPAATEDDILDFIVACVSAAGSNPCPPVVVGVGLGGTSETAALLAKRALLRSTEVHSADPFYAAMEARALHRINALGIGPMGLGGSTTALGVCILPHPTHIAGLPCAVNLGCHATRHATAIL
ncbi:MAG: fumarate hydratase [Pseudoflavonifractor sp.]